MWLKFGLHLLFRFKPAHAFAGLAVDKEDQGGDAHHLVLHGDIGVVVYVNFDNFDFVPPFSGELFDDRVEHFARATPDRAKIDEDRFVGL